MLVSRSIASLGLLLSCLPVAALAKDKYGELARPLSVDHAYLRKASAPDYWALAPYYTAQYNGVACSLASVAMLVNAARVGTPLKSDDMLVTQKGLLDKVAGDIWKKGSDGMLASGVTLDQLGKVVEESLKAFGVEGAQVEVVRPADASAKSLAALRRALKANEASAKDFIVANYFQGTFTSDPEGVGHVSPVAAYDAKSKRVLVMDPDRDWYEPHWVSDETFLQGMLTVDSSTGKSRGYVRVTLR